MRQSPSSNRYGANHQIRLRPIFEITIANRSLQCYALGMDTSILIQLPDGTWAYLERGMTWGDATIILLLVTLVFVELIKLWRYQK